MIHRNIEESLNLSCVQIDGDNACHPCRRHQIGDEFRRDRLAAARLAILPRIRIVGDDRRNAVCRRALARIRQDQQFHEVVVHRIAGRLNDENILPADTLLNHHLDLTVVELSDECLTERNANAVCDCFRQLWIGISRQDTYIIGRKTHLSVPPKYRACGY